MAKQKLQDSSSSYIVPPVVAVLGHVDHGKTTLLDSIRKTDIAKKEHGGITQAIGASSVEIVTEGKKRKITFVDTPGHEAFILMRGRGLGASDIGLLVVSLVDGVMPQTKESIKLLKDSKIPFIVVLTKSDDPQKNEEKVKQQLLKEEVLLEGYGGDVPYISVSARTNTNIKELLELILLVFEIKRNKEIVKTSKFQAVVIESYLDQKSGPKATIVIKSGILSIKDEIFCEGVVARVRTIIDDKGEHLKSATVGEAVEILGFEKVPEVGGIVFKKGEMTGKIESADEPVIKPSFSPKANEQTFMPLDFLDKKEEPVLSIILCADNLGSLEAIVNSLPKEVSIAIQKTGDISPADILHAKSINAIVIGFNVKIKPDILKFATQEKVLVKNYKIIYELLSEIKDVLEGKQLSLQEEIYGKAKVQASFPFEKTKVLGIKVLEGRVARGDKIRLIRKDEIIGESTITSVRIGKEPTSKVEEGQEAGILILPFVDFTIGDMVICYG